MFRRLSSSLPKDPAFPADLEKLGYFVNDDDHIRMVEDPSKEFVFKVSKNDRVREANKEAFNECTRKIVLSRLRELGLRDILLPIGASSTDNHVPILVSKDLLKKKRVIVVFGEPVQDLGIWAYRTIGQQGINIGSAVDFVKGVQSGRASSEGEETPGIVIANTGQLIFHRGGSKAMTVTTWGGLPRKTAVHPAMQYDEEKNAIPGNEKWGKHIAYVFDNVLDKLVLKNAKIDIIGLENGGFGASEYLAKNSEELTPEGTTADFATFISRRCRAYLVSDAEVDTPIFEIMRRTQLLSADEMTEISVTGREMYGYNCYASGEKFYSECIMVEAWKSMLSWFKMVHAVPGFAELEMEPPKLEKGDEVLQGTGT